MYKLLMIKIFGDGHFNWARCCWQWMKLLSFVWRMHQPHLGLGALRMRVRCPCHTMAIHPVPCGNKTNRTIPQSNPLEPLHLASDYCVGLLQVLDGLDALLSNVFRSVRNWFDRLTPVYRFRGLGCILNSFTFSMHCTTELAVDHTFGVIGSPQCRNWHATCGLA